MTTHNANVRSKNGQKVAKTSNLGANRELSTGHDYRQCKWPVQKWPKSCKNQQFGRQQKVELIWNILEYFGIFWNFLEYFGIFWNIWEKIGIFGNIWEYFGMNWNFLESFGIFWNKLVYFGIFGNILE